jgi:DNA-binding cell septation regulator SpoVG
MTAAETDHVTIETIKPTQKPGAVKAFVTFVVRGIRMSDARIVDGSKGQFVAYPQRAWESRDGTKYSNIVEITDPDLREAIERQILAAWRRTP